MSFACNQCSSPKQFSNLGNLNQHLLRYHKIDHRKFKVDCPENGCQVLVLSYADLNSHLESAHQKVCDHEKLTFQSHEGKQWF